MAEQIIAALDIGTYKTTTSIVKTSDDGQLRAIGFAVKQSDGVTRGFLSNADAVTDIASQTISAAEKMAGLAINKISTTINGAQPTVEIVDKYTHLGTSRIQKKDCSKLYNMVSNIQLDDHQLLHIIPHYYKLDDSPPIHDPVGLFGHVLQQRFSLVFGRYALLQNMTSILKKCHLNMHHPVSHFYGSALGVMVKQELEHGSLLVDIGAGTTQIALMRNNAVIFSKILDIGGGDITKDIAHGLNTPLDVAEKCKTKYGSVIVNDQHDREYIDVPRIGEDPNVQSHLPLSYLNQIIAPRAIEICELIQQEVQDAKEMTGVGIESVQNIVLSGGGAYLVGMQDALATILGRPVRIGKPQVIRNLPDYALGPEFACVNGAIIYASQADRVMHQKQLHVGDKKGRLHQIRQWFHNSF